MTATIEECGPLTAAALRAARGEPMPTRYVDTLPSGAALFWHPADSDYGHLAGFVRIVSKTDDTTYSVSESPALAGRVFVVAKHGGKGTDKKREWYCTAITPDGAACECDGNAKYRLRCKHILACEQLVSNGWV